MLADHTSMRGVSGRRAIRCGRPLAGARAGAATSLALTNKPAVLASPDFNCYHSGVPGSAPAQCQLHVNPPTQLSCAADHFRRSISKNRPGVRSIPLLSRRRIPLIGISLYNCRANEPIPGTTLRSVLCVFHKLVRRSALNGRIKGGVGVSGHRSRGVVSNNVSARYTTELPRKSGCCQTDSVPRAETAAPKSHRTLHPTHCGFIPQPRSEVPSTSASPGTLASTPTQEESDRLATRSRRHRRRERRWVGGALAVEVLRRPTSVVSRVGQPAVYSDVLQSVPATALQCRRLSPSVRARARKQDGSTPTRTSHTTQKALSSN